MRPDLRMDVRRGRIARVPEPAAVTEKRMRGRQGQLRGDGNKLCRQLLEALLMRQGQQACVLDKLPAVDLLDPPGEGAGDGRCRLPALCGFHPACGLLYMLPDRVHVVT